jgi:hypothetical protein
MKSLEQLDFWIGNKVKAWSSKVSGPSQGRELLEIRRDILADFRDNIQPKGQGKSVFPYNTVSVHIAARDAAQQSVLQGAFAQDRELEQDFRALLEEADCPQPAGFSLNVSVIEDAARALSGSPFEIDYSNTQALVSPEREDNTRPTALLTIIRGEAEAAEYSIASDRVHIGRLKEVLGERNGLRRRNDVAFAETETTISREHAYIRYHPESRKFRLYDSMSQGGTSIFRDGRRLEVPKGAARGVQLRSGDEIHLGDARILFQIRDQSAPLPSSAAE